MKLSTLTKIILLALLISVGNTNIVLAHPGNTASDGAHYCWTRCDYWGEVYGERHYHGGGNEAAEDYEEYDEPEPPDVDQYEDYDNYTSSSDDSSTTTSGTTSTTSSDVIEPAAHIEVEGDSDNTGLLWAALGLAGLGTLATGSWLYLIRNDS